MCGRMRRRLRALLRAVFTRLLTARCIGLASFVCAPYICGGVAWIVCSVPVWIGIMMYCAVALPAALCLMFCTSLSLLTVLALVLGVLLCFPYLACVLLSLTSDRVPCVVCPVMYTMLSLPVVVAVFVYLYTLQPAPIRATVCMLITALLFATMGVFAALYGPCIFAS